MTSAFHGEYNEGDLVQCQRCAKNVRVKYYDHNTVVIVSTKDQQTLALRCQYCGYVICDSCAHPAESLFPICPSCQREWGPYYFTHDIISPSLSKASVAGDVPTPVTPQDPSESEAKYTPLPAKDAPLLTNETLAAGDVDFFRDELDQKHRKKIRRVLTLVFALLFLGVVAFAVFGRGGSWLKKSLKMLSARPTHAITAIQPLTDTMTPATTLKTATPTLRASSTTFPKPSSTLLASIETKPPTNTKVIPSTTKIVPTVMVQFLPTATETLIPTFTNTAPVQGDCVQALSVTLADVGKELCVTGIVEYTTQKGNSFSIYFSKDDGDFRIVVYDRVPKGIEKGVCVKVTGVIKELLSAPVIAPGFKDVIEICSP
jgi:hypothetical protein